MYSKQIVITVALTIANVCEFNYIHSNYNDIHYWTNPKISLIRMGAGPKLFGLVRFHCITVVFRLIHGFTCAGILPGSSSAPRLYSLTSLMSSVNSHCIVL